jgi:hypothetical protein
MHFQTNAEKAKKISEKQIYYCARNQKIPPESTQNINGVLFMTDLKGRR